MSNYVLIEGVSDHMLGYALLRNHDKIKVISMLIFLDDLMVMQVVLSWRRSHHMLTVGELCRSLSVPKGALGKWCCSGGLGK